MNQPVSLPPQMKSSSPKFFVGSELVTTLEDEEWLLSKLSKRVKELTLLFNTSKHGFKKADWVKQGLGKQFTLHILKSSANRIFGGYMHVQWEKCGWYRSDRDSFIFSLTQKQTLTPTDTNKAIYFYYDGSVAFGGDSLNILCDPLNK